MFSMQKLKRKQNMMFNFKIEVIWVVKLRFPWEKILRSYKKNAKKVSKSKIQDEGH